MKLHTNRSGFALPLAILVIGVMTAGALAAFARTGAEAHMVDNQVVETQAFASAERGLGQFLAAGNIDNTNVTYDFGGGESAVVTALLMRAAPTLADTAIWLISSTGRVAARRGRPAGQRTVAQLAYRTTVTMEVHSSWTSLSGLDKNGSSGVISGVDACTCAECTNEVKAGIATPTGGYDGQDQPIAGDPPHLEMGTPEEMAAQIHIDWDAITNPAAPSLPPSRFLPDAMTPMTPAVLCTAGTYPNYIAGWTCGQFPSQTWFDDNPNEWPTIIINGNSPLPADGRGTLIVTGDLDIGGGQRWEGILLVGGRIIDNGTGDIAGAVVTGLNVLKDCPAASNNPCDVPESSRANGTKSYTYDSCKVNNATSGLSRLVGVTNAWVDNWATW
jgi:hypothetical protein